MEREETILKHQNFVLRVSSVLSQNAHQALGPFYSGTDAVVESIIDPKEIPILSMD